jgi:putative component of membrane protein insertase Oxa1/YidC/SpoIIIJ protein YidD
MSAPIAVKVFTWQWAKSNLFRQKITENPLCSIYELEAKTTGHVLWGCMVAKTILSMCGS